jgi:hypothetical protein
MEPSDSELIGAHGCHYSQVSQCGMYITMVIVSLVKMVALCLLEDLIVLNAESDINFTLIAAIIDLCCYTLTRYAKHDLLVRSFRK